MGLVWASVIEMMGLGINLSADRNDHGDLNESSPSFFHVKNHLRNLNEI